MTEPLALLSEQGTPLPVLARVRGGAVVPADPNLLWDPTTAGTPIPEAELTQEERTYAAREENRYGRWVTIRGRRIFIRGSAPLVERKLRALRTHKASTRSVQQAGHAGAERVAQALGAQTTENNDPFDVVFKRGGKTHAVEVKTFLHNKNDKVTMHPESLRRKLAWARRERAVLHTVVVDARKGGDVQGAPLYHRHGVGSFRLAALAPVRSAQHLRAVVLGAVVE